MTNRFFSPNEQFANSAGAPFVGGSLAFYLSNTDTPQATYSDQALSLPNANPITLDAAGRAGSVFLSNAAYKVVLTDSIGNQVWTNDPVYASDYSTPGRFLVYAGNPNGNVAGNQGGGTVPASSIWDSIDNLIYVCTTTGNAAAAVWTAVNATPAGATPTGAILSYGAASAPTGFVLCDASSYLRASFAALFAAIGTTYGSADGSHFNVPDLRGTLPFGKDNMGGSAANRVTVAGHNFDGTVLGGAGGSQNQTLTQAQLPAAKPTFTGTGLTGTGTINGSQYAQAGTSSAVTRIGFSNPLYINASALNPSIGPGSFIPVGAVGNLGSGASHPTVMGALIVSYIIKT